MILKETNSSVTCKTISKLESEDAPVLSPWVFQPVALENGGYVVPLLGFCLEPSVFSYWKQNWKAKEKVCLSSKQTKTKQQQTKSGIPAAVDSAPQVAQCGLLGAQVEGRRWRQWELPLQRVQGRGNFAWTHSVGFRIRQTCSQL